MLGVLALLVLSALVFDANTGNPNLSIELNSEVYNPSLNAVERLPRSAGDRVDIAKGESPALLSVDIVPPSLTGAARVQMDIVEGSAAIWHGLSVSNFSPSSGVCRKSGDHSTCRLMIDQVPGEPDRIVVSTDLPKSTIANVLVESIAQHQRLWPINVSVLLILILFVPVSILIGFLRNQEIKLWSMCLSSCILIGILSYTLLIFIVIVTLCSYFLALARARQAIGLRNCVVMLLAVIFAIKVLLPALATNLPSLLAAVVLPLGLSYLVARHIDLLVKITARQSELPPLRHFLLYSLYWPSLAAGPITEIALFYPGRTQYTSWRDRSVGLERVAQGLLKKAIADLVQLWLVRKNFDAVMLWQDGDALSLVMLSFGNMLFVYLDFSAYSDIAIGSARLMGIALPENFNFPLLKSNLRQFWQSWHMSLTRWVTRNVFMPLSMAVRRQPSAISYVVPVLATTLTIGIWHGLSVVWILWGIHHAVGILLTDLVLRGKAALEDRYSWLKSRSAGLVFQASGIVFVWYWLMLSYSFTLSTNVGVSAMMYLGLLAAPFELSRDAALFLLG